MIPSASMVISPSMTVSVTARSNEVSAIRLPVVSAGGIEPPANKRNRGGTAKLALERSNIGRKRMRGQDRARASPA
jgi:hypothetical protein